MATASAKETVSGGGAGVGRTVRAEAACLRMDRNEAGVPRVSSRAPFRSHSHGPMGLVGPLISARRAIECGRPTWAVHRASGRRHSRMGRGGEAGLLGLGLATSATRAGTTGSAAAGGGRERCAACATVSSTHRGTPPARSTSGRLPMVILARSPASAASASPDDLLPPTRGGATAGRRAQTDAHRRGPAARGVVRRARARNSPKVGEAGIVHRASNSAATASASSSSSATSAHRRPRRDSASTAPPGGRPFLP